MRPWIKCAIFAGIVISAIFICLTNFWLLVAIVAITFIALIILSTRFVQVRSFLGWLGFKVGNDNNYRLYALAMLSLIFFIFGFKYGAGEPLFLSTYRDTINIFESSDIYERNKDDIQSLKNRLTTGLDKTDSQLEREKAYIKYVVAQLGQQFILKERENGESPEIYNQKMRNHLVYGTFVDDLMIKIWLKNIPADFKVRTEKEVSERTWIFWKLGFLFLFLSILYLPFALADEAVELLEKTITAIRRLRTEYTSRTTSQPVIATVTASPATNVASIAQTSGWFAKLFASDVASEITIKIIERLIKILSR